MSKFHFDGYKAMVDSENELYDKKFAEAEKLAKENSLVILNAAGDINGSHSLVETEAKKKWLASLQEKNPFIGKSYMQRAPEYERDSEEVKEQEYMDEDGMKEALDEKVDDNGAMHIKDDYNPNVEEDDVLDHDEMSRRFVEACVIDKAVTKCIGWKFDDVLKECADALLEEFGDMEDFSLPDDFDKLVETSLEKAEAAAQLLNYEKSTQTDSIDE